MKKVILILGLLICGALKGQTPAGTAQPTAVGGGAQITPVPVGSLQETHRPPDAPDADVNRVRAVAGKANFPQAGQAAVPQARTPNPAARSSSLANRSGSLANQRSSAQQSTEGDRLYSREITIYGGTGISGLYYDLDGGVSKMGAGINFGAAYTYFMHNNVSASLGLGLSFYNTTAVLPMQYYYSPKTLVMWGDDFYIEWFMNGYTEKQRVMTLSIPIMLSYVSDYKFYIKGGIQLGIPVQATYAGGNGSILQGYQFTLPSGYKSGMIYDEFRGTDILSTISAGTHKLASTTTKMDVSFSVILSIEAGLRLEIFPKNFLYTGIFFDFGVNNLSGRYADAKDFFRNVSENDPPSSNYQNWPASGLTTNGLLNSRNPSTSNKFDQVSDGNYNPSAFVTSSHLMAAGIRISYAFSVMPMTATSSLGDGGAAEQPRAVTPWENLSNKLDALLSRQNAQSAAPKEKAEKPAKAAPKKVTKKQRARFLRTVREPLVGFAPRQTTLSAEQKDKLSKKANALRQLPTTKITVYGYTSDLGGDALAVGLKRAQAVKNYLVQKGVKKNNISVVSRGAESPLVPNTNAENRKMNSRVEILEK